MLRKFQRVDLGSYKLSDLENILPENKLAEDPDRVRN